MPRTTWRALCLAQGSVFPYKRTLGVSPRFYRHRAVERYLKRAGGGELVRSAPEGTGERTGFEARASENLNEREDLALAEPGIDNGHMTALGSYLRRSFVSGRPRGPKNVCRQRGALGTPIGCAAAGKRLALVVALLVAVLAPLPVQAAAAAGPSTTRSSYFNAVSCASAAVCVAVGALETDHDNATGQVVGGSFQPIAVRTADSGRTWSPVHLPAIDADLRAVSCWSPTSCVAVGGTRTVYNGRWYSVRAVVLRLEGTSGFQAGRLPEGALALDGVSCPRLGICVAVGGALALGTLRLRPELLVSTDGGAAWRRPSLPVSRGQLESVSCASVSSCVALGATSYSVGAAAMSAAQSKPVGLWTSTPATGWHVSAIGSDQGGGPRSVSCQSARHCVAVGDKFDWCWCGTGTPGEFGSTWVTSDGGATWSQVVLPILDGYVVWYANAVSCWVSGCAMGATLSTVKSASDYYAGIQRLGGSGAPAGALATSAGGLRPQYVLGLWCHSPRACVAVGQDWAHPAQAAIETDLGGHWTTTYSYQPAAAPTYTEGAAVAQRVNALTQRWGSGWAIAKLGSSLFAEIRAGSLVPTFALGLVDNLSPVSVLDLVSYITYGARRGRAPLLDVFVTAYRTARVSGAAGDAIAMAHRVDTNSFDQLFLGRLRGDEPALADLTSGMSSVGIALWSGADSGYPGITPFEDAALTVVEANWPAYANFAGYRGPFSKLQLAALVAASATNDAGRKSLTDSYGNWFIAHGGVADVTGGASLPSLAHLTAWLSGWDNLNAAVAAPTGQYLYDTEEKIHLAIVATAMVGEWVALSALTDIITGFVTKNLVAAAVGASTAFRAWSAEEETFSTALRAGLNTFLEARHASNYDEVVNLVKDSIALNGKVNDILSLPGKIEQASKDVKGAAARAELQYYLRVLRNTFHGAVARLMQEHMIVTADLQPHWQDSVSAVNQVTTDPGAYLVVPPGSYGHAVPVPPQVVRGEPVYRGIPVTFVEAVVFSQFFRSLH